MSPDKTIPECTEREGGPPLDFPLSETADRPVNDGDHLEAIEAQLENVVCPTAGPTTCAQSDLRAFFNGQHANKLCNFVCPNVESTDPNDPNSGYLCHDTNHQTRQYDWCCMSPDKTIPECTEREATIGFHHRTLTS